MRKDLDNSVIGWLDRQPAAAVIGVGVRQLLVEDLENSVVDVLTSWRYAQDSMDDSSKRATVYFDADLHRALRMKAASNSQTISEIVNEAVRRALAEDAEDLAAFKKRSREPRMNFETLVGSLRKRGKI
jgi:hypothetical protein